MIEVITSASVKWPGEVLLYINVIRELKREFKDIKYQIKQDGLFDYQGQNT